MMASDSGTKNHGIRRMFIVLCTLMAVMPIAYINISLNSNSSSKLFKNMFRQSISLQSDLNSSIDNFEENDNQFVVFTPSCHIPNTDPFDKSILKYYKKVEPIECNEKGGRLTYTIDNKLIFDKAVSKSFPNPLYCCTRDLRRVDSLTDNRYEISHCQNWNKTKKTISNEFIKVECIDRNKKVVYVNFHAFVVDNKRSRTKFKNNTAKDFSVLLLGIDAVSRLNFHRHMEKTKKIFIEQMGAIELLGYNKVGDNTFPNLMPMLSGLNVDRLKTSCWKEANFDNCSFIWKDYSLNGYLTAMIEDNPNLSTFNYLKKGFYKQPTDYYPRPLLQAAEKEIGYNKPMNCKMCYGPNSVTEVVLKYVSDYFKFFKSNKTFAFAWINSLTHDILNYASKADPFYSQFFTNLTESGILEDTIVVFLSDHGIRWGGIVNTEVGKLEERLPLSTIYIPPKFKAKYPGKVRTLMSNARRLTTPYDIFHTLRHLINIENAYKMPDKMQYGQSLFEEVDRNRTCESAGIPVSWCTCLNTLEVDKNSEVVKKAAFSVINKINNIIKKNKLEHMCSKLSLKRVISASIKVPNNNISKKENSHKIYYSLVFETNPGAASYETMVKFDGKMYNSSNQIGRTNLYKDQAQCLKISALKKFCFCKN